MRSYCILPGAIPLLMLLAFLFHLLCFFGNLGQPGTPKLAAQPVAVLENKQSQPNHLFKPPWH